MKTLFHENLKPEDKRPPKGGWAPGDYMGMRCRACGCEFCGDKRAYECADCAYADPPPNRQPSYWYCQTCDQKLDGEEVTPEELHDPVYGGCGFKVVSRSCTTNRPPSCDLTAEDKNPKKNATTRLSDYYESMPDWCRQRWFQDSLLQTVAINSAQRGDSLQEMLWDLIKCQNSDRDGLKQVIQEIIGKQSPFIPRRSEVAELLRLVDSVIDTPDWTRRDEAEELIRQADQLRKKWKL